LSQPSVQPVVHRSRSCPFMPQAPRAALRRSGPGRCGTLRTAADPPTNGSDTAACNGRVASAYGHRTCAGTNGGDKGTPWHPARPGGPGTPGDASRTWESGRPRTLRDALRHYPARTSCAPRRHGGILAVPARPAPNPAPTLTPSASMGQRGTRFPGTIVRPSPAGRASVSRRPADPRRMTRRCRPRRRSSATSARA
jgi:hypothetical protein